MFKTTMVVYGSRQYHMRVFFSHQYACVVDLKDRSQRLSGGTCGSAQMDAKGFRVAKSWDLGRKALRARSTFHYTGEMVSTMKTVISPDDVPKKE